MSPDEWLGIVHWLAEHEVSLTADQAVKYGARLLGHDADQVRQACAALVDRGEEVTPAAVVRQIRVRPSKFTAILEAKHRQLFPNGCRSDTCDVCHPRPARLI